MILKIQPKTSILTIPHNNEFNPYINIFRMILAIYIFVFHLIPRYIYGVGEPHRLWEVQQQIIVLFQGYNETNPAVIAFIVISGYCVHRNGLRINKFYLKNFFRRRFIRIVPMFIVGSVLGVLTYTLIGNNEIIANILNTKQITINTIILKTTGVFGFFPYNFETISHLGNGPLITCVIEFWLYMLYPLGLLVINKYGSKIFVITLSIIMAIGAVCCRSNEFSNWWHHGSILGFIGYWWIGVYANSKHIIFRCHKSFITIYVLLSILVVLQPNLFILTELRKISLAVLVAMLLKFLENLKSIKVSKDTIGFSYSLYCMHVPLIAILIYYQFGIFATFFLTLFISYACYLAIEKTCKEIINNGLNKPITFNT